MLTREQLLQAGPLAVERVELPAFGDSVFVRELGGVALAALRLRRLYRKLLEHSPPDGGQLEA